MCGSCAPAIQNSALRASLQAAWIERQDIAHLPNLQPPLLHLDLELAAEFCRQP